MKQSTKTTVRTILQGIIGLAAAAPLLLEASGIPETTAGVGLFLAVCGGITRVMALPRVQQVLDRVGLGTAIPDAELYAALDRHRLRDGHGGGDGRPEGW